MPADDDRGPSERPDRPDYKVYKSRPGFFSRFGRPDLDRFRGKKTEKEPSGPSGRPDKGSKKPDKPASEGGWTWRRGAKWAGIAALAWLIVSIIAFAISAQIQKGKLADMGDTLHGNPFMAVSPQTVLVLGTDVRPSGLASNDEATPQHCIDAAGKGETPPSDCTPYRSDTIMLIRAGIGTFRKLSIPRDTLAAIPGHGTQKINAGYAFGGAKLETQTIENFLGINVDQVAIVDFQGFRDLINTLGGIDVTVNTKVCSEISGGAENGGFSLFLDPGTSHLDGDQALSLARTRENNANVDSNGVAHDQKGKPCPAISDLTRATFQQDVLNGIKDRLTSITRIPYNFLHGPFIAWDAPKAFVSSMGVLTLPQFVLSSAFGGSDAQVLQNPDNPFDPTIPHKTCVKAVKKFLGEPPPNNPECSPGG
jgi:LCP family protein required for cell wall assembly